MKNIITYEYEDSECTIEELYNMYNNDIELTKHGHENKRVSGLQVLTTDNTVKEVFYGDVKRLIRHRVSKGKWSIRIADLEVIMTSDHGAVVYRDKSLQRVKPSEILETDELVYIKDNKIYISDIKSVEHIGEFENEYVYDIEMKDDPHVFFANDILIHNSIYINIEPLVNSISSDVLLSKPSWQTVCKTVDELGEKINTNTIEFVAKEFNSDNVTIKFGREHIASSAAFLVKKAYILRSINQDSKKDENGYIINEKFKLTGLSLKKSEHPSAIKEELAHIIYNSLKEPWDSVKYNNTISVVWNKFKELPPHDIAYFKGYNTEKEINENFDTTVGTGANTRAALYFNTLIKKLNIQDKYDEIQLGDRFRFVYLVPTNAYGFDVIAWNGEYPEEFKSIFEIDTVKMFEKIFLKSLEHFEDINYWVRKSVSEEQELGLDDL